MQVDAAGLLVLRTWGSALGNVKGRLVVADRYEIEGEIGRGAMSVVFRAQDLKHDRKVAVKVLRRELTATIGAERFLREIQITSNLQNPHVLPLFDSGEDDGLLYYVMPLVVGQSLRERLDDEPQLPIDEAVQIACEVAAALSYAHRHGVVHRDIKPGNILLSGGHAIVADFGIARAISNAGGESITATGLSVGTPAYMSPEQADGKVDFRSDLYSLGCVLYEMLIGEPPFTGPTARTIMARHAVASVPYLRIVRKTISVELEQVVFKMLAKVPADRFATAGQCMHAILEAKEGKGPLSGRMAEAAGQTSSVVRDERGESQTKAIAVLPLVNMSADRDNDYFSDGMTDEIIAALAKVKGLRVASRTSVFALKKDEDIRAIGQRLNVDVILEGSIRRSADTLRITTQLTDVADGHSIWAETYERDMKDVFAVQEEISRAIVETLQVKLVDGGARPLVRHYTENVQAYNQYLRGRFFWNKRSPTAMQSSLNYFDKALKEDPEFVLAYVGVADSYLAVSQFQYVPPTEVLPKAEAAVRKAMELDDGLAEAHATLAHIHEVFHWDWDAATISYQRSIELNPDYATAHAWYADFLQAIGRTDEGVAHMERALELEPLAVPALFQSARMQFRWRHYDDAIEGFRSTIELDQHYFVAHVYLALAHTLKAEFDQAIAILSQAIEAAGAQPIFQTALAYTHAMAGAEPQALELVGQLTETAQRQYVPAAFFAIAFAGLPDLDQSFDWLNKAYDERSALMVWLAVEPYLENLHADPRFDALIEKMRLGPALIHGSGQGPSAKSSSAMSSDAPAGPRGSTA